MDLQHNCGEYFNHDRMNLPNTVKAHEVHTFTTSLQLIHQVDLQTVLYGQKMDKLGNFHIVILVRSLFQGNLAKQGGTLGSEWKGCCCHFIFLKRVICYSLGFPLAGFLWFDTVLLFLKGGWCLRSLASLYCGLFPSSRVFVLCLRLCLHRGAAHSRECTKQYFLLELDLANVNPSY